MVINGDISMTQSFLAISYPLSILDEIILKTIILHPGIVRGNLTDLIEKHHGIDTQTAFDVIMSLYTAGLITIEYQQLKPVEGLKLEHGIARIGGMA